MNRIKGILYAAVSSSTFGLAPFFSITLLLAGFSDQRKNLRDFHFMHII